MVRPFDFETDDSNFSIIIRVTDEGNLSSQSEILIHYLMLLKIWMETGSRITMIRMMTGTGFRI